MAPSICRKAAEFLTPTDPETTENTPLPRALAPHLRPQKRSVILAPRSQHPLCDNCKIPFARPWSRARDIVLFGV